MKSPKKLILLLIVCLLNILAHAAKVQTITVYFAKDKFVVNADEGQKLYAIKNADLIMLHGHTDADGSNTYNEKLSADRVNEVKRIVAQIAPNARIETKHYGEYQPINSNVDETEKTANRRVEVSFIIDPVLSAKIPVQSYTISDVKKEQVIKCNKGTEVIIPAGTFTEPNVKVQVTEYYNPLEIFSANLTTTCNNTPIETAGMIYITAEANGKNVEPQKALTYKFPRSNKSQDFRFFSGVRDSSYNINWVLPQQMPGSSAPAASMPSSTSGVDISVSEDSVVFTAENGVSFFNGQRVRIRKVNETDFGGLTLTTTVDGVVRNELDGIKKKMADGFSTNDFAGVTECLINGTITIEVNADGRITKISTNHTDNDSYCERTLQTFVSAYLPKRFTPVSGDTKIKMMFTTKLPVSTVVARVKWEMPKLTEEQQTKYTTDYIVMESSQLGWINCDRFMSNSNKVTYSVRTENGATVRLVMNKYRAFFNSFAPVTKVSTSTDTLLQYKFENIPGDEPVTLISTKNVGTKIYLAIATAVTGRGLHDVDFKYKEVTKEELQKAISELKI